MPSLLTLPAPWAERGAPPPPEATYIVAEIGKGFIQSEDERPVEEYLANAIALVDAAAEAGVDAVKFQTHEVSDEQAALAVTSPHFRGADRHAWVSRNTRATPLDRFWMPLIAHCRRRGVTAFTTPMSRGAARKLAALDLPFWKVGSGDLLDFVLLDHLAATGKPVILSTGMASWAEVDEAVSFLAARGTAVALLYCVSQYPAPAEHFNLATIERLRERYPHAPVGFSDHSIGHEIALAAIAAGARILEKHFSFSRTLWGSDHKVSMTPRELADLVRAVRNGASRAVSPGPWYGRLDRELDGATNEFRPYFHKTLVAAADLAAGTTLTRESVLALRPRLHLPGLPSNRFPDVLGRTLDRSVRALEPLPETVVP
ncbi:MAG TPA: N-acetylneuraminate synthase family protein [Gemmatimonadales bacterium]|jgi:sialic acid synthase SpsE|nr:N-acetylneuraminate synthase family protein [Gemmatimonadales bacterium]